MKKVGILTPYYENFGGAEVYIKALKDYINSNHDDTKMICYIFTSDIQLFNENNDIEIPRIDNYKNLFKNLLKVIKIIKSYHIDTIILNDSYISWFGVLFRIFGIDCVSLIHLENQGTVRGKQYKIISNIVLNAKSLLINIGSRKIFSVNKTNLKYFSKRKTTYVGNFIKINEFTQITNENNKKYDFIFVGRFVNEKNIEFILDIFKKYIQIYDDKSKLLIIGDGHLKNDIIEKIKNLNIENNVELAGFLDRKKVIDMYSLAKCMLLFSKTEGFPTVILESLANGVPCIVSDVGSNSDVIKNGLNGYVIKLNEKPERICEKMRYTIINNYRYSDKCRDICKNYDENQVLHKIVESI